MTSNDADTVIVLDGDPHFEAENVFAPENLDPREATSEEVRLVMIKRRRAAGLPDYPEQEAPVPAPVRRIARV